MPPVHSKFYIDNKHDVVCSVIINGIDWFLFARKNDNLYFLTRGIDTNDSDPAISTSEFVNLETRVAFTSLRFSNDYECTGPVKNTEGISVTVPTLQQVNEFRSRSRSRNQ